MNTLENFLQQILETMATFKITKKTTVAELKRQFGNEVGGTLRIYEGRSEASDNATLVSLGAKEGELECRTSRTVGSFEKALQDELNLKAKVYTKDNWVKVLDGITLETASKLPNGMTKAKMEEYVSNYSKSGKAVKVPEELKGICPIIDIKFEKIEFELNDDNISEYREKNDIFGAVIVYAEDDSGDFESCVVADGDVADMLYDAKDFIDNHDECKITVYASTDVEVYGGDKEDYELGQEIGQGLNEFVGANEYSYDWNLSTSALFRIDLAGKIDSFTISDSGYFDCSYGLSDAEFQELIKLAKDAPKDSPKNTFNPKDYRFSDGLACVEDKGKCGYIDETGSLVIPIIYNNASHFKNGMAVVELDGKWGCIDTKGNPVIEFKWDWIGEQWDDDTLQVSKDGKNGWINLKGELIIDCIYDDSHSFIDGLAQVKLNGKWGIIDKKGTFAIEPKFDKINGFSNGCSKVKLDGKWGSIDQKGNFVIEPRFDDVNSFNEGYASVKLDGKWGFIDQKGNLVVEPKFDDVNSFNEGYAGVELDGKWGFIDQKGNLIIEPKFDTFCDFHDGSAYVELDGEWFSIDTKGNKIEE